MPTVTAPAHLVVLPSLAAVALDGGAVRITRKFVEGMQEYARHWSGPITVLMEPAAGASGNLDDITVAPGSLGFQLRVLDYGGLPQELGRLAPDLVLASIGYRQNAVAGICRALGIACVYVAEYTLTTREQIVRATTPNPLRRLRRLIWERGQERRQVAALRLSSGVQCNGTPTFDAYQALTRHPFLFFDTRLGAAQMATAQAVEARAGKRPPRAPLRLLFSGRLVPMKGALDLVDVALRLKSLDVAFVLTICGGGESEPEMRRRTAAAGLEGSVRFAGVLDFHTELVPLATQATDLFLCCHIQGDPSCTYLETLACGVPIVGYDNEAFAGIVARADVGWSVPLHGRDAMARRVAAIAGDPAELAAKSRRALAFAQDHGFEDTFARRIAHLQQVVAEHRGG